MRAEPKDDAKPPPELAALDYFVGTWSCDGLLEATADGPARKIKGSMICRWELGKFYLSIAEDGEQTLAFPRRRQSRAYWGYDSVAKVYTCAVFFYGGGRIIGTSPGWHGDTLTFAGAMVTGGAQVPMRHSLIRRSDEDLVVRVEVVEPDGSLTKRLEETCHREGEPPGE
jgi:uncharacterized protein DUF1579